MHTATFFNGCQYHQSLFFSKVCSTVVSKEHRITVYCKGLSEPKGFGSGDGKGKGSKHAKGLTKKAFGTARPRRAVALEEGSPQFKKLLKEVEKGKLNIDPNVAAKGKVDFVRVESWGSGVDPDKQLENLKMKSFSPSFTSLDENAPLYEQLVRRLQLFEAKGDIAVVQAKPLPPFEKWVFDENHYLQFLTDQASIYTALEDAVSSVKQSRCSGQDEHIPFVGAAIAVSIFDKDLGLNRSKALKADIESLSSTWAMKCAGQNIEFPKSTTQAIAYAKV